MHRFTPFLALFILVLAVQYAVCETPEPKWLKLNIACLNLDQVTKIEVQDDTVTFIGRDKRTIYQDKIQKDVLARFRTLMQQSPNWIEACKARNEFREWYVNLSNAPLVGVASFPNENIQSAVFSWTVGDIIAVSSSNSATEKAWLYFSRRGYVVDQHSP